MFLIPPSGGVGTYKCGSAYFDGSNDYLTRGSAFTGQANGKVGILSVWIDLRASDSTIMSFLQTGSWGLRVERDGSNKVYIICSQVSTGATAFTVTSTSSHISSEGWFHILCAWDNAAGDVDLYIDDVSVATSVATNNVDNAYDWSTADTGVGATYVGGGKSSVDMAELYLNIDTYTDLSVTANRRKFIDAAGKPVDLGADGSTPTGSQPMLFLHLDDGEAAANFSTNAGDGGGMTTTGTITAGSSSPTD